MSHFICAVLSKTPKDIENLLAPYCETDERYFEFELQPRINFEQMYTKYKKDKNCTNVSFEEWLEEEGYATDGKRIGIMLNPNTKWDYWTEVNDKSMYPLKAGEKLNMLKHAKVKQIDFDSEMAIKTPYCFVTPDGKWHEWFEMNEFCDPTAFGIWQDKQGYMEEWEEAKQMYPEAYLTYVDCHI